MKNKVLAVLLAMAISATMFGCGSTTGGSDNASGDTKTEAAEESSEDEAAEEADAAEETEATEAGTFTSKDGWTVRYNPEYVEANELDEHSASFVYTQDAPGSCLVTISYIEGKQPEEAMSELTDAWEDQERSEGFFPGTTDKWGYWRTLVSKENGSGIEETIIGGQYNGGALLFDILTHKGDDEEQSMLISDILSEVIAGITYENFEPQDMYSYIPGTYTQSVDDGIEGADPDAKYSVVLNEDHTGKLILQDEIEVNWGSTEISAEDGSFTYEYTIEGDNLLLNYDGEWITFTK